MQKNCTLNISVTLKNELKMIAITENVAMQTLVTGILQNFVDLYMEEKELESLENQ